MRLIEYNLPQNILKAHRQQTMGCRLGIPPLIKYFKTFKKNRVSLAFSKCTQAIKGGNCFPFLPFFRLIYIKKYIRHISKNMNRSTVGIEKSFYYEFLKKRQNKKAVYPRYTAPCLTKIYYFFITRFITSSFGSNGFWWVSIFKESLKTALLTLY